MMGGVAADGKSGTEIWLCEIRPGSWVHNIVFAGVLRVKFSPASASYAPPPRYLTLESWHVEFPYVTCASVGAWLPAELSAYGYEKTALVGAVLHEAAVAYSSHVDEMVPSWPNVGATRMFPIIEVEFEE